jgi:hypothetical protein
MSDCRHDRAMVSPADVRRIALALPETYEQPHRRAPTFWVNKRIFCMLPNDSVSMWGDAPVVLKLEREDQLNMIEGHPGVVEPAELYSHHGWTNVRADDADEALMRVLLRLAWTHVAPKRLSKAPA